MDPGGYTPLSEAYTGDYEVIVKYLVEQGTDVNVYEKGNEEIIK